MLLGPGGGAGAPVAAPGADRIAPAVPGLGGSGPLDTGVFVGAVVVSPPLEQPARMLSAIRLKTPIKMPVVRRISILNVPVL